MLTDWTTQAARVRQWWPLARHRDSVLLRRDGDAGPVLPFSECSQGPAQGSVVCSPVEAHLPEAVARV